MLKNGGLTYGQANVFCWFLFLLGLFVCFELFTIPLKKPDSGKEEKKGQQAESVSPAKTTDTAKSKTEIPDAKPDKPMNQGTDL